MNRPSPSPAEYNDLWHNPRLARWAGWAVVALAALLYLATLDSGLRPDELSGGDLITHQYAQVQARPSNAPGYPLYTMGGWLWFHLSQPLLSWALNPVQHLSSYSTLWALLALAVLYRLILRSTRGHWPLAALSTAFYAVTYFFWYYSVTTEQYTSAIFQTVLMVWLAFKWDDCAASGENGDRYLMGLGFVVGTCLANLVTVLLIAPPLLWFVVSRRGDVLRRPALIARCAGLALLPVASYAYVYVRGAAHPEWRGAGQWPSDWAWFVDFLTTHQGRDEMVPGLTLARFFTGEFPALIWGELTWLVLAGGLVGLWCLGRRRALFLYGSLALYAVFCWVDRFGNWFQVIMPVYPLIILGFAAGLAAVSGQRHLHLRRSAAQVQVSAVSGQQIGKSANQQSATSKSLISNLPRPAPACGPGGGQSLTSNLQPLILIAFTLLVAYRFAVSLPRADQSHRPEDTGLDPGWAVLADHPLPNSVVLGETDEWLALQYLDTIWEAQPPVVPLPLCRLPASPASAVYLTRRAAAADPACLADQHRYAAGTTLIRAQADPNTQLPASAHPLTIDFGPTMTLAGFEMQAAPGDGGLRSPVPASRFLPRWRLSLYWRAAAKSDVDYTISVRPLQKGALIPGGDGQPVIQDHQPVWNAYPTSRWSPGEIVRDDYGLDLPGESAPDGVQIVVYRVTAGEFENLGEATLNLER
jgi:hypothetical protein